MGKAPQKMMGRPRKPARGARVRKRHGMNVTFAPRGNRTAVTEGGTPSSSGNTLAQPRGGGLTSATGPSDA